MTTSVTQVLTKARSSADMVSSLFCTNDEFIAWIEDAAKELYDILIQTFGHHYFLLHSDVTGDGTAEEFALPVDFYKLAGVDYAVNTDEWRTLKPFNFPERNKLIGRISPHTEVRYRIQANTIKFSPKLASGQAVRVWYVPKFSLASNAPTLVSEPVIEGDEFAKPYNVSLLGTLAGATPVVLTFRHEKVGSDYFWELYKNGTYMDRVAINSLPTDVVLATLDSYLTGLTLRVAQGSGQSGPYASKCSWIFNSGANTNYLPDVFDPWLEYLEAYAAAKALAKEESDTSGQLARMKALRKRIEEAAENRDAAMALTVSDSTALGCDEENC